MDSDEKAQELFIEQAEYIETSAFSDWTVPHPNEDLIQRKLSQRGAKLISGPRGCGKTTLLLRAYHSMIGTSDAFPAYVNFKVSLKLEPLYKKQANASLLFNQWMLCKIYQGLYNAIDATRLEAASAIARLAIGRDAARDAASRLELGDVDGVNLDQLTPARLQDDVSTIIYTLGRTRCVLLLDDAAHAFSPEQQRDFFELFRQLKNKFISPKAAIYPGVTIFSPSFHIGHDAEEVDVWVRPDSPDYLKFLQSLLQARLPSHIYGELQARPELLELMCQASFGMPRALLNMVRSILDDDGAEIADSGTLQLNRKDVLDAVRGNHAATLAIFESLAGKLPMYADFVTHGKETYLRAIDLVKDYNRSKEIDRQSTTIAIKRTFPPELEKVLSFLQYAGLILAKKELSRGEKGVFSLYELHYSGLIERNALMGAKAVSISDYVRALKTRHAHEFTRTTAANLIGAEDASAVFSLRLPPCQVCKTPRMNEGAKFCLECGARLISLSVFESLVSQPIDILPLTELRVRSIKKHSRIRQIKDILMDHDQNELLRVPRIGPYWANRIYAYAEEYIA